ncbi:MAG: EVE domain-containing protein [Planctomycetota bacterium]|nr:EVE domain-containing protein [Planctomycetota bacterium]
MSAAPRRTTAKARTAAASKPKAARTSAPARPPAAPASTGPRHWLLKTDPDTFPFESLWRAPGRTTGWDGVRNHLARNYLRDGMRTGDLLLIYHSSCDPAGVLGVGRVASAARPDPTQFDPRDEHFDAKSRRDAPTWWEVDVQALARCPRFVSLADLRAEPRLAGMAVLQKGQRLSVQPVEAAHFALVLELAGVRVRDLVG